jgi:hypothetical protein
MLLPVAALGLSMFSAAPALADDTQAWGILTVNGAISGPVRGSSETVLRTSDAKGFYELEQNFMIGYKADKTFTFWLGYTHDPQYSHGNFTVMERRFRQQVQFDNFAHIGKIKFNGRMRLEERWRENQPGTGWRLRPYVKAIVPIQGKTALNLSVEPFIDLGRTGFQKVDGLERTRTQISISTPISKHLGIEVGYLNQHGFVRNGPDTNDHVAVVGLTANF